MGLFLLAPCPLLAETFIFSPPVSWFDSHQWVVTAVGRFHPLLVHFPIVLLVFVLVLEVYRWWTPHSVSSEVIDMTFKLGMVFTGLAILTGSSLAWFNDTYGPLLTTHFGLGIGTLGAVGLTLWVWRTSKTAAWAKRVYPLCLGGTVALVLATGHWGASLTHGPHYLTQDFPKPKVTPPNPPSPPPRPAAMVADNPLLSSERLLTFEKDIQPIFEKRCYECHGAQKQKGGLRLDSPFGVLLGGDSGAMIVAGHADQSLLYELVSLPKDHEDVMPQKGAPLSALQIQAIRRWINQGAYWTVDQPFRDQEIVTSPTVPTTAPRAKSHWAFSRLHRPPVPTCDLASSLSSAIDRFIVCKTQTPLAPQLNKAKMIRRASFGLMGLPPSPEELNTFLEDSSDTAYAHLVNRLLASPHYGERWARHWLDVARYADSSGFESDTKRDGAYLYRDFVIRALNEDMPFDQFVKWQLAGDQYAPDDWQAHLATGFLTAGVRLLTEPTAQIRYDEWDDMLHTTGVAVLGMSFGCARCHDHKFDPISQKEYYQLLVAFKNSERIHVDKHHHLATRGKYEKALAALQETQKSQYIEGLNPWQTDYWKNTLTPIAKWFHKQLLAIHPRNVLTPLNAVEKQLIKLEPKVQGALNLLKLNQKTLEAYYQEDPQVVELQEKINAMETVVANDPPAWVMIHRNPVLRPTHVLGRGEPHKPKESVHFEVPDFLTFPHRMRRFLPKLAKQWLFPEKPWPSGCSMLKRGPGVWPLV